MTPGYSASRRIASTILAALAAFAGTLPAFGGASVTSLAVTHIANTGYMLEVGEHKVLVDALFESGYGLFAVPPAPLIDDMVNARPPFDDVDLVLATHWHDDHMSARLLVAYLVNNTHARLVTNEQVAERLKTIDGFEDVRARIRIVSLEPGKHERIVENDIALVAFCLDHSPFYREGKNIREGIHDTAYLVDFGGITVFHPGDTHLGANVACLESFPFAGHPVDLQFHFALDETSETPALIKRLMRPRWLIGTHMTPRSFDDQCAKTRTAFPQAVFMREPMQTRIFEIRDVSRPATTTGTGGAYPDVGSANTHSDPRESS